MDSEHLEAYLSGELDEKGRRQVEHALRHDAGLRSTFVVQAQMEAALRVLLGADRLATEEEFERGVVARLRSEGAGDRGFAKSVLLEIVEEREGARPLRWPDLVKTGLISAAASIGLLLLFQSINFREIPRNADPGETLEEPEGLVARIERSENATWDAKSAPRVGDGGWLAPGLLRLESGTALIAFNSGATALVEGPADLRIESGNRMFLKSGRLAAEVPPKAYGFTVNTPRLNAVDLGTRFGVSVDREGNSELHVMEGEVAASRTSGNAVAIVLREGLALRADSRTRTELQAVAYRGEEFRLRLGTPALTHPSLRYSFDESLGAILEDSGADHGFDIPLVASGELDRSPRRAPGRAGGGLVFQPGETLDLPISGDFHPDSPHTLGFWVKLPARFEPAEEEHPIVAFGRDESLWKIACNPGPNAGARGALSIASGEGSVVGGTDLADGKWHHVAYRYLGGGDLASRIHLFVDGKPESISHSTPGAPAPGRTGNLRLGGDAVNGFQGWVDEVNLFREAVSTHSIQGLAE